MEDCRSSHARHYGANNNPFGYEIQGRQLQASDGPSTSSKG